MKILLIQAEPPDDIQDFNFPMGYASLDAVLSKFFAKQENSTIEITDSGYEAPDFFIDPSWNAQRQVNTFVDRLMHRYFFSSR